MRNLLATLGLISLALSVGCGPDNRQFCIDTCKEAQAQACIPEDLDLRCEADVSCPASWNDTGVDYSEYIECVWGQYQCTDSGAYDFVDADCRPPAEG